MSALYLISTLLMGLLVVAVALTIARTGQRATPSGTAGGRSGYAEWSGRTHDEGRIEAMLSSPLAWTLSFILLGAVFLAGTVLTVTDASLGGMASMLQQLVLAVGALVLLGFVFFGAYFAVRERNGMSAAGVGVAAGVLGILLLIGVAITLIVG